MDVPPSASPPLRDDPADVALPFGAPYFPTVVVLAVAGAAVRLAYFSFDTSLWGDEAALALNLRDRSWSELLTALDHGQHAPYLFLVAEKALFVMGGLNEQLLRLPGLLASLLILPLFAMLVHRMSGRRTAVLAMALLALCPSLVRYAAELKPYASDALATVAILFGTLEVLRSRFAARWLAIIAIGGAVLVWMSFPAVFVLAGAGLVLIADRVGARDFQKTVSLAGVGLLWLGGFVALYLLQARNSLANEELHAFWAVSFAPFPPTSAWELRRTLELFFQPFEDVLGLVGVGLGGALFILGVLVLVRRDFRLAGCCVLPILAAFLASALGLYPYASRLLLFAAPPLIIVVAEGAAGLALPPWRHLSLAVLMSFLLAGPIVTLNDLMESPERSGVRDVIATVGQRAKSGDAVYVYYKARYSFDLYRERLGRPDVITVVGRNEVREGDNVARDLKSLSGHARVWFLFSEVHTFFVDEEALMLETIGRSGSRVDRIAHGRTRAYLYQSPDGRWIEP